MVCEYKSMTVNRFVGSNMFKLSTIPRHDCLIDEHLIGMDFDHQPAVVAAGLVVNVTAAAVVIVVVDNCDYCCFYALVVSQIYHC